MTQLDIFQASETLDAPTGRESQNAEILAWLKAGNSISPLDALERFGCFRLGARCYDLRKQGHKIITTPVERNGKRFASYSLETTP